jgi:hypothetical protein
MKDSDKTAKYIVTGVVLALILGFAGIHRLMLRGVGGDEKARYSANTKHDLKLIRSVLEHELEVSRDNFLRIVETCNDGSRLQELIDALGVKVRAGTQEMKDYAGNDYLISRSNHELIIWSIGYNRINESGKGDDIIETINLNLVK